MINVRQNDFKAKILIPMKEDNVYGKGHSTSKA